jgi:hypothetical protein
MFRFRFSYARDAIREIDYLQIADYFPARKNKNGRVIEREKCMISMYCYDRKGEKRPITIDFNAEDIIQLAEYIKLRREE